MFLENDFLLEIARGKVPGLSCINKFGRNSDVDASEDIWDGGGLWVPPTAARLHNLASGSTTDKGTLLSSGTVTESINKESIIDINATFISDGVTAGDTVLDDTNLEHATVISVPREDKIITTFTRHNKFFAVGDEYRVVTPATSGASIIHITGLDQNMTKSGEFVILDGTTSVSTLSTYWRVDRMHIDGAKDRNTVNAATVTCTAQTDLTITAQINPGNGQTLMAIYTVPRGCRAYMVNLYGNLNRAGGVGTFADISIREVPFASVSGSGNRLKHFGSLGTDGSGFWERQFRPFKEFDAESDIILRVESVSAGNADISGGFDLILVDY
jgi:hypothetical protein